jgi:hypothetical protein
MENRMEKNKGPNVGVHPAPGCWGIFIPHLINPMLIPIESRVNGAK